MDLGEDKWIFIWSGVGGGVIVLLALFAALTAYLCARHNHRRRPGGGSPYLPLYDEEAAMPRGRKGKGDVMSAEASLREYLEDNVATPPETQQHRIREEEALMNARYYLRSSMAAMDTSLPGIGHRKRKFSFLVRHPQRGLHLMTMVHRGINCVLSFGSDSGKATFCNLLQSLRHPYVCPTLDADFLAEKEMAVIFRAFQPKGSLKDLIYRGLAFFQSKGFMYGHLHSGNVILDNKTCRLTDYENSLLNVMPRLQPFFLLLPDRQPDVIAFAHLLFEMAAGRELTAHDQVNEDTLASQPQVLDILKRILGLAVGQEEALRTVTEVLHQPFFFHVQLRHHSSKKTRIDSKGLDMLKAAHRTSIIGKDDFLALEGEHELGRSLRRCVSLVDTRRAEREEKRRVVAAIAGSLDLVDPAADHQQHQQQNQQHDGPAGQDEEETTTTMTDTNINDVDNRDKKDETDPPLERMSPPAPTTLSTPLPPLSPSSPSTSTTPSAGVSPSSP
ncbi:uncharacterized protein ACA1_332500 [Acanthamoeba castellanii str. Neff]|uniref:Uncharacterized protein n=1 Tax=Acanthamoeba castellanii (strain ATCC 30010 / Neff) TaxID=1257118 RepID=L8GN94_ACACF|nr:uncharacterized protein ACA1_332500 [Acanthamoeba castellanii str. Neff]ELR13686.1 hypothetical protein ACA1_332500 [Acanthamoeba castellanii str. Neff]